MVAVWIGVLMPGLSYNSLRCSGIVEDSVRGTPLNWKMVAKEKL